MATSEGIKETVLIFSSFLQHGVGPHPSPKRRLSDGLIVIQCQIKKSK